jgi:MFS family permease
MNEIYGNGPGAHWRAVARGWRARVVATIGLFVGGLTAILLYLAFLASRWAWYQNLTIVLAVLLVVPTIVFLMWLSWGISVARRVRSGFQRRFPD